MEFFVRDQNRVEHRCLADGKSSLMQAIRDSELEIAAQCGGCCSCATCHVYVDPQWLDRLSPPSEEELAMLDLAMDPKPESRLSCQIVLRDDLSGLRVTLAPGSIV